jgi:S1/P1 Nuclease
VSLIASLVLLTLALLPLPALAWNIPGHMLSGIIAYQVLQQENPQTIDKVKALLEKHPWYANQWQARLQDVPIADHGLVLFIQAARWPDDIRRTDKQYHRGPWYYINWPFKPEGQPAELQTTTPEPVNILTALAENERIVKNETDGERRAIALAWLFHLVGDIHHSYTLCNDSRLPYGSAPLRSGARIIFVTTAIRYPGVLLLRCLAKDFEDESDPAKGAPFISCELLHA